MRTGAPSSSIKSYSTTHFLPGVAYPGKVSRVLYLRDRVRVAFGYRISARLALHG